MPIIYRDHIEKLNSPNLLGEVDGEPRSQTVVGITKLVESEPEKALEHFESALAKNHELPAAWLGKAYAEAMESSPEREYAAYIRRSVKQSLKHSTDQAAVIEQFAGILGTALKRNAELMEESIERAKQADEKAKEKEDEAFWSAVGAVASAGVALKSDGDFTQAAAGAGAVGAAGKTAHDASQAEQLEALKDDMYGVAVGYLWYSLPLARNAAILREEFPISNPNLIEESIELWKESACNFINKEKKKNIGEFKENKDEILEASKESKIKMKINKMIEKTNLVEENMEKLGISEGIVRKNLDLVTTELEEIKQNIGILRTHRRWKKASKFTLGLSLLLLLGACENPLLIPVVIVFAFLAYYLEPTDDKITKIDEKIEKVEKRSLFPKRINLCLQNKNVLLKSDNIKSMK